MAITVASALATLPAGGPALGAGGQLAVGPGQAADPAWYGVITVTGDGSATTLTVNWIDGTATIPFTPTGVRCSRIGGTDTAAGLPFPKSITTTSFQLNFTVAPANTTTQIVLVELFK